MYGSLPFGEVAFGETEEAVAAPPPIIPSVETQLLVIVVELDLLLRGEATAPPVTIPAPTAQDDAVTVLEGF